MKFKKPIRNLTELEKEIYRLQVQSLKLENKMGNNFNHLKENFPQLVIGSFFTKSEGTSFRHRLSDLIWSNEKVQTGVNKLIDVALDKAGGWLGKMFRK